MSSDELLPRSRAILDAARDACDPTGADRTRIDAALTSTLHSHGVALALGASSTGAGAGAAAVKGLSVGVKLGLTFAATTALLAGVAQIPSTPTAAPAAVQAAAKAPAPTRSARVSQVAPEIAGPSPQEAPSAPPALPEPAQPRVRTALARTKPAAVQAAPPRADDPLGAELALIQEAADALRLGRHAFALRLLEAHALRFPAGALREERNGLRVLALCGSGNTRLGQLEKQRFLTNAPRSVLADKVRQACSADTSAANPVHGEP